MKAKLGLLILFVALTTMGFDCINDNYLLAINVQGISGTYHINPGPTTTFASCSDPIPASTYLGSYSKVSGVRIYDIQVSTIGSYSGNVNGNAYIVVNGVQTVVLSYSGPWSSFSTPQSLVNTALLTRNPTGISALVNAILSGQTITVCGSGSVSQVVSQNDLYVKIEVLGQFDGHP